MTAGGLNASMARNLTAAAREKKKEKTRKVLILRMCVAFCSLDLPLYTNRREY